MGHREIALIISACIIFVSIVVIIFKYAFRNKKSKVNEKIKEKAKKIQEIQTKDIEKIKPDIETE